MLAHRQPKLLILQFCSGKNQATYSFVLATLAEPLSPGCEELVIVVWIYKATIFSHVCYSVRFCKRTVLGYCRH